MDFPINSVRDKQDYLFHLVISQYSVKLRLPPLCFQSIALTGGSDWVTRTETCVLLLLIEQRFVLACFCNNVLRVTESQAENMFAHQLITWSTVTAEAGVIRASEIIRLKATNLQLSRQAGFTWVSEQKMMHFISKLV